jgi:glutaminyl-peptide cyclotransferase
VLGAALGGCSATPVTPRDPAPIQLRAQVLARIPHDPTAFTQGLELADGTLYEGTGLEGESVMRAVDPATGSTIKQTELPADFFGEGITVVGDTIWQLTFREGVAIQRDRGTLAERRRASYGGEGWGLCHDAANDRLVMSNGTDRLTFRDPRSFEQTGEMSIKSGDDPVAKINELECAHGAVFANIFETDTIVRIDPTSGRVTADVDLTGLLPAEQRARADVLNGIAAVPGTDEFLVTGKYWPTMYRVRFVPAT